MDDDGLLTLRAAAKSNVYLRLMVARARPDRQHQSVLMFNRRSGREEISPSKTSISKSLGPSEVALNDG